MEFLGEIWAASCSPLARLIGNTWTYFSEIWNCPCGKDLPYDSKCSHRCFFVGRWVRIVCSRASASCLAAAGQQLGGQRRTNLHQHVHLRTGQAGDESSHPGLLALLLWGCPRCFRRGERHRGAADQYGFIMIFPQTSNNCWDVGSTESLTHDGGGDTQAIAQMVKYTITTVLGERRSCLCDRNLVRRHDDRSLARRLSRCVQSRRRVLGGAGWMLGRWLQREQSVER